MFNLVTSFSKFCQYLPFVKFTVMVLAKLFTSHFYTLWPRSSSSQLNGKNTCDLKKKKSYSFPFKVKCRCQLVTEFSHGSISGFTVPYATSNLCQLSYSERMTMRHSCFNIFYKFVSVDFSIFFFIYVSLL